MHVKHLIVGAGPTGLGAGRRLAELGADDFLIIERHGHAGGLSASFKDDAGFTWDIGGHVVFSHYDYFDRMLDEVLGEESLYHERESWVRIAGGWVPYPFQNNIRHLPRNLQWECVQRLLPGNRSTKHPENFLEWFEYVFGKGISNLFMRPYNFKVWATRAEHMAYNWIGERVSVIDYERVLHNIIMEKDDVGWGPNNTFRFPEHGGTGAIFRRVARKIEDRIRYDCGLVSLDVVKKEARTTDGSVISFDSMLSTMPLDLLARDIIAECPDSVRDAAEDLVHNGVYVTGTGVAGTRDDNRCWMYFPEDDCPFYRVTNFHNYSPNNTPNPGTERALMAEVSYSDSKPEQLDTLMDKSVQGLRNVTLLADDDSEPVMSRWEHDADYGYPIPTLGRDAALETIQPWLEKQGIHSRGRFGGWKYEVGNMDHSVMQGVEWAERMVQQTPETTYKV